MEKILLTPGSADATSITVILLLRDIVIKELALSTEVFSHATPALCAILLDILLCVAQRAYNLLYLMARNLMPITQVDLKQIFGLIVTMPAIKHLAAARRPNLASPPVVRAAVLPGSQFHLFRDCSKIAILTCVTT